LPVFPTPETVSLVLNLRRMEKNAAPQAARKPAKRGLFQSVLAPRKLAFYTAFHGFHMAVFVLGW
jgi:hypothetical protein